MAPYKKQVTILLLLLCWSIASFAQTCPNAPDPQLEDVAGDNFIKCSSVVGSYDYSLTVNNISNTKATNKDYTIEWGDGSKNTFGSDFSTASHTYKTRGKFDLKLTVTNQNGCSETKVYTVFNGSNPAIGLQSPGNTSDCAPATFTFGITNTANNSPSTTYKIWFDDGSEPMYFTQANVPTSITHTFTKSSRETANGFTMYAEAVDCFNRKTPASISGIIVSAKPIAGFTFKPGSPVCVGTKVDFIDESTGGFNGNNPGNSDSYRRNWSISPSTGWSYSGTSTSTSEKPSIIFHEPGNYVVKLKVDPQGSSSTCQGDEATKTVVVQAPAKAAFTLLPEQLNGCVPNQVRVDNQTTGAGVQYTWAVAPAEGVTFAEGTATSASPVFKFTASGSYKVTLTAKNACGTTTAIQDIVIKDKPTVTLPTATEYCGPQTITFTEASQLHAPRYDAKSGTINKYQWTLTGGQGARFAEENMATAPNPTVQFTLPGTYTAEVEIFNECGGSSKASQTITIKEVPAAPVVNATLVCHGTSATLQASGQAAAFKWYASETAASTLHTGVSFTTPALTATTTYFVEAVSANNCVSPRTPVTVTVQPLPVAPTVAEATICAGSPATLTATAVTGPVKWYAAATGGEALFTGESFTTPALNATTTYYAATVTPEGCSSSTRTAVKVTVQPAIAGNVISQAQTLCLGGTATTLTGNGLSGGSGKYTYLWESSTDGTTFTNAAGTRTSANYNPGKLSVTTWFRRKVTSGTCVDLSTPVKVTVVPAVTNNTIVTATQTICSNTAPSLLEGSTPAGGNGGTPVYLWESSTISATAGFVAVAGNSNTKSYQPGKLTNTTWFRRSVTIDGCTQVSEAVQVSVNPLSLPPTADNQTICSGTSATLTAVAPGGPYEWYTVATGGSPIHTGDSFETPVLTATTTYYVQSTATGGCTVNRTAVKVTVQPAIANNTITKDQEICEGTAPAIFIGSKPTGGNGIQVYTWEYSTDGENFSTASGTVNGQNYNAPVLTASTWFRRKVTMGSCVAYSNAVKVTVTPALVPVDMPADVLVCAGSPVPALQVPVSEGGNGTYTYKWEKSTTSATEGFTTASGSYQNATYAPGVISTNTWFRRITYSGTCQLVSGAVKVTVLPLPGLPTATGKTICQGSATVLTATPGASDNLVQWYDAATGGNLLHEGHSYTTPELSSTATFYAQAVAASGCPSAGRVAVKVTVNPTIATNTITTGHTICAGSASPTLIGSSPTGGTGSYAYAWEMSTTGATSDFGPVTGISTQINYSPGQVAQTTWYRRIVTSGACTDISAPVKVEVLPAISQNSISTDQDICAGATPAILSGTLPLGGIGDYTYQWESSTTGSTSGFAVASGTSDGKDYAPAELTKTTWFRRKVTSGACAGAISNVVKITVAPLPATPQASAVTVCHSERATLTVKSPVTGVSYEWYEASTGGNALGTGTSFTTANLTQSAIYYVQAVNGGCASPRTAVAVVVLAPIANNELSASQEVCAATAAGQLTGTTPTGGTDKYTYQWESSQDGVNFSNAAGSSQGASYSPGTLYQSMWYRRVVKSGTCVPHVSAPVKISVYPPMSNNFITADQVIYGSTKPAPFSGTTPAGGDGTYTYEWQSSINGSTFTPITGATNRTYASGPLEQTTWFRRVITSGGCQNISNIVKVTISALVSQNTITGEQTICAGTDPTQLTGSDPIGGDGTYAYAWEMSTTSATSGFTTAPGIADDKDYSPSTLAQTTWFRRKVSSGSSTQISNVVKVTVVPAIAQNSISSDQTICANSAPARITGTLPTGGSGAAFSYIWEMSTVSATSGFATAPGTSTDQHYTPGVLVRTTWFRRKVAAGNSCSTSESNVIKVTVTPQPNAPEAQAVFLCAGNSTELAVSSTAAGAIVEWYDQAQGGRLLHTGFTFTTPVLQETTTYYVQTVSQNCASPRSPIEVSIPEATANAGADITVDLGQLAQLQATGGVSYQWSPAAGLNHDNIANPTAKLTKPGKYEFTVTVTTAEGCTSTDEVEVYVREAVKIYNGFTPNGDTSNDTWDLPDLKDFPECTVEVFNRWGNKVFESKGYQKAWDGRHNGQPLPAATYYYIIRLDGKDKVLSGNVTIIK